MFLGTLRVAAMMLLLAAGAMAQTKKEAVVWPAADLKWTEMKGGPPGISYANLWGHMDKGAYGAFVKLPAGMNNPLHTHSSDMKLVVISGTFYYTPEGGTMQKLGPGSYLSEPGGVKHMSGTSPDGPCVVFQEATGKFDMKPVKAEMK
jgi:quercetin dioxygenase-like cupin family protein